jgi:hypothetical protein
VTSPDDVPSAEPRLGEVERVPLKVVPIYVTPLEDEPSTEPPAEEVIAEEVVAEEPSARRRTVAFVFAAVILALGTVGAHIAAISVATAGDFPTGTLLGYLAIGLSALALVVGLVAVIRGRGRAWAIGAIVVAIVANPAVLLAVLRLLSELQTT